jgi:hypothetical protein
MSETHPDYIPAEVAGQPQREIAVRTRGDLLEIALGETVARLTPIDAAQLAFLALKRATLALDPIGIPERLESRFRGLLAIPAPDPLDGLRPGIWRIQRDDAIGCGVRCTWLAEPEHLVEGK